MCLQNYRNGCDISAQTIRNAVTAEIRRLAVTLCEPCADIYFNLDELGYYNQPTMRESCWKNINDKRWRHD